MKIHLEDCDYISGCSWENENIKYMLYKEYSGKEKQITEDIELYANNMYGVPCLARIISKEKAIQLLDCKEI